MRANVRRGGAPGGSGVGNRDHVVLVHGLWMHGMAMQVMAHLLGRRGYRVHRVSYDFLRRSPAESADKLAGEIAALGPDPVHLVGHSLGGIVILHLLDRHPESAVASCVLIGSPVRGSGVARQVHGNPLLRPLLGRSIEGGLLGGAPEIDGRCPIGMITGRGRFGIASLLYPVEGEGDGVVAESETLLENVTDRITLPRSHSALIFSRRCAKQVAHFIENGRFDA